MLYLKLWLDDVLGHVQSSIDVCWYADRAGGGGYITGWILGV
jgi:hypothetical protein